MTPQHLTCYKSAYLVEAQHSRCIAPLTAERFGRSSTGLHERLKLSHNECVHALLLKTRVSYVLTCSQERLPKGKKGPWTHHIPEQQMMAMATTLPRRTLLDY